MPEKESDFIKQLFAQQQQLNKQLLEQQQQWMNTVLSSSATASNRDYRITEI